MPITLTMPALSPTMTEGTLARWLKQEGDHVKSGQVIAEIETDKATMEVEAVDEGRVIKLLIPAGTAGVAVNTPIALIAEDGEDADAVRQAAAQPASAPIFVDPPAMSAGAQAHTPIVSPSTTPPAVAASPVASAASAERIFASPLARRLAEQAGIHLANLIGSGPNGRIIRADVEAAEQKGATLPVPAVVAQATGVAPATASLPAPMAAARSPAAPPHGGGHTLPAGVDARDLADKLGQAYDLLPNSNIRKVIAKRLMESKLTVPHFYLTVDCRLDELLELRKKVNSVEGIKASVNDFVIRAVALALRKVPAANAAWTDEAIMLFKSIDVAVAVATPFGLITPIVKQADAKGVAQISKEMKDLAQRAKDNKLRPEEFQGGGFSISNLGMFGVKDFKAIINPPQACILAVGAGEQRAVVTEGVLGVATVMSCTLSVDHRAVDGAVGAEFLQAFKALIEQPYGLVV